MVELGGAFALLLQLGVRNERPPALYLCQLLLVEAVTAGLFAIII